MNFRIPKELKVDLTIDKMDKHTWMISEGYGRGRTHCYLLEGNNNAALIDTGIGLSDMRKITEHLTDRNVFVINTHGHLDHTSCNYQYPVNYIHPKDEQIYKESCGYKIRHEFWLERLKNKGYSETLINSPEISCILEKLSLIPEGSEPKMLSDGMEFELGGRGLQIIETPGHTAGSVCIYEKGADRLYTGDMICEKGVLLNFEYSTKAEVYKRSIEKLKQFCGGETKLYPGHQDVPLSIEWLDDYIECADVVLENQTNATWNIEKKIRNKQMRGNKAILYI